MTGATETRGKIAAARLGLLFCIFFLIACGLGYPVLNRFDPRQTPGLSDVKNYAAMVNGTVGADAGHVRFRVLVPWIARLFYRLALGRAGSWDPVMFGLLVADSLFVAGTAVLIVMLGARWLSSAAGLVGAFVFLVNFAVPNLRVVGLVDAGEGFFLLALLWSLSERALWALPLIGVLGTLTKESFVPFSIVLSAAWWLSTRDDQGSTRQRLAIWILVSWALSFAAMMGLQRAITDRIVSPLEFGVGLHHGGDYIAHFIASLGDRNLWYIFGWLLPCAVLDVRRLPRTWLIAVSAACVMAFGLDAYFGGAPGTVGRALFSIAGPCLSLSCALFLLRIAGEAV